MPLTVPRPSVESVEGAPASAAGIALGMDDVRRRLREFLQQFVRVVRLQDSDNIFEQGFVNSLFAMQLVLFVEQAFGLVVEGEDLKLANFSSIDALTAFVIRKRQVEVA